MVKISPSSLNVRCPRYLSRLGAGVPPETIPDESCRTGQEVEGIVVDAILNKRETYQIGDDILPLPREFRLYEWETQKEVRYVAEDLEIEVHGFVDLYCPELNWIVDVKSSYQISGADSHWKYQMGAYALHFWAKTNEMPKVSIFFARHGALIDISVPSRENIINRLKEVKEIVQSPTEQKPSPSSFCYLCQYAMSCPGCPEIIHSDPQELVKQYLILDAKLESIKQALSSYTALHGTLETPEAKVGHFPVKTMQVAPEFWEKIQNYGIDILSLVNPDKRKVDKIVKNIPELANYIHLTQERTRFAVKGKRDSEQQE